MFRIYLTFDPLMLRDNNLHKKVIHMKRKVITILSILLLTSRLFPQLLNEKGTILVSTNPMKLIFGIVNLEIEYMVSPSVSLELGSEYVFGHYIIRKEKHPDIVMRAGPRYHLLSNKDCSDRNDLYLGAFGGFIWSKDYETMRQFNFGPEFGYKHKTRSALFFSSKIFLTSPYKDKKMQLGMEGLTGFTFR